MCVAAPADLLYHCAGWPHKRSGKVNNPFPCITPIEKGGKEVSIPEGE